MRPRPAPVELFLDARQVRTRCLAELGQAMDGYLRSPAFLEWMSRTLLATTELHSLQMKTLLAYTTVWEQISEWQAAGVRTCLPAVRPAPSA
jgi:hypothetical protein